MTYFEKFIVKANKRHSFKYDYSKFNYINAKTKSIIICPIHGEFSQTPDKHLESKIGCPDCVKKKRSEDFSKTWKENHDTMVKPIKSKETFVKNAEEKFGKKFEYDLSNYTGTTGNNIGIKCPIHGWFEKVPHTFMVSGEGCTKCGMEHKNASKTKTYDNFIIKANQIHSNYYTYSEENKLTYKNRKSIVKIFCPKHGEFEKKAQKHLTGQGCFRCRIDKLIEEGVLVGGYNKALFNNNADIRNLKGVLYYLSINDGECYKVGIAKNLEKRIKGIKSKGNGTIYKIKVLHSYNDTLENVYYLEQDILKKFKKFRITKIFSTELFNKNISNYKFFKDAFKLKTKSACPKAVKNNTN